MKEDKRNTKEARTSFFKGIKKEGDLDDFMFDVWKLELQKDLSTFWESMIDLRRK